MWLKTLLKAQFKNQVSATLLPAPSTSGHNQQQHGQVPGQHSPQYHLQHGSLPSCPHTHSAGRAHRCSFWSQAARRCSPCHHCGEPGQHTRGCASGCIQCCTLTICSTPSMHRPLQATKHRHVNKPLGMASGLIPQSQNVSVSREVPMSISGLPETFREYYPSKPSPTAILGD